MSSLLESAPETPRARGGGENQSERAAPYVASRLAPRGFVSPLEFYPRPSVRDEALDGKERGGKRDGEKETARDIIAPLYPPCGDSGRTVASARGGGKLRRATAVRSLRDFAGAERSDINPSLSLSLFPRSPLPAITSRYARDVNIHVGPLARESRA